MALPVIAEQDFEREVLRSELPVLIDFTPTGARPAKRSRPRSRPSRASSRARPRSSRSTSTTRSASPPSLRIQAVPTFMVFARGRPVAAEQGVLRRNQLREMVEPFLPRAEGAIRAVELAQAMQRGAGRRRSTRATRAPTAARASPARRNIPIEEIESRLAELHMLPGAPILYCRSGDKTKEMADKLAEQGVPVGFLEGGFLAWEAEGAARRAAGLTAHHDGALRASEPA